MHPSLKLRFSLFAIAVVLTLGLPVAGAAQSDTGQSVNPGINQHYQDPDYQRWVNIFERPGREVYDLRHEIVAVLELKPGMDIADVGAGTGLFTRLFARQVGPSGKVYAVDIAENFIDNILRTAREQGLNNVRGIVNDQRSSHLPGNAIDMVFISDTYHHFEYPQTMLASIHQALRPHGRLVIIDYRKQAGVSSNWAMSHVRANQETVVKEIESADFTLKNEPLRLRENYFLVFDKR